MTEERQDILEDFYSGNFKTIEVTVRNPDQSIKDLTNSEVTYAIFTNGNAVVLRKSTNDGVASIDVPTGTDGKVYIYMRPWETTFLNGTFRHQVNVVDANGNEETVTTGTINIFRAFALRYRTASVNAYIDGG